MAITIYKDSQANAIFISDANGVQFLNSLQATSDPGTTTVSITDIARDIELVTDLEYTEFVDDNGAAYGTDALTTTNALNSLFSSSGSAGSNAPVITSPLTISLVNGQSLNYELQSERGVAYEWDLSNVPGVTTVEGNAKKIVGGSSLSDGVYGIPVKVINYFGEDSATIVLTVSTPGFSNSRSVEFSNQDWLGGNAGNLEPILGRTANGAGSGDAWTISLFFKPSTATNGNQTVFYYGYADTTNNNHFRLRYHGTNQRLEFNYGSTNNRLLLQTPNNSLITNQWHHIMVTYDGGTTGAASGSESSYYGRFDIFIDGVQQTTSNSHTNYGTQQGIVGQNFRIGRYSGGAYMRGGNRVDEIAIWDSDQTFNLAAIRNGGVAHDLLQLTDKPSHWWRMGDGDTYPTLQDSGTVGTSPLVMYNMTAANIVNDVPV